MILKDIADVVGMDISTISRVANSKYIQTPYGTFLLKSFFSESMTTETGRGGQFSRGQENLARGHRSGGQAQTLGG